MAALKKQLRQSISRQIAEPVAPFEEKIADSLKKTGEFTGHLEVEELALIMRKVLFTLVDEQRVIGFDVPIAHNVSRIDVSIGDGQAEVFAELHVHSPITSFIQFRYCLENDGGNPGKKLRLKDNHIEVKEMTRPLDLGAKAALRIMNVKQIALKELSDPNAIIQRTLPPQLQPFGFQGIVTSVELELTGDDTMAVHLVGKSTS